MTKTATPPSAKNIQVEIEGKQYSVQVWKDEKSGFRASATLDLHGPAAPPRAAAAAASKAPIAAVYKAHEPTEQQAVDNVKSQIRKDLDRLTRERARAAKS